MKQLLFLLLFIPQLAFGMGGGMQGGFTGNMTNDHKVITRQFPEGLTWYENFEAGTDVKSLTADYSIGSPDYTYTSTSGVPTLSGGYNATTANDDVLSYLIAGNRTAEQETIVIKFSLNDNLSTGTVRHIFNTDTKLRQLTTTAVPDIRSRPNQTDNNAVVASDSNALSAGVFVVYACVYQHNSPYVESYRNGISVVTYTGGDWINPVWGNSFYLGATNTGANQLEGKVAKVRIYNRVLSANELLAEYNL